MSHPHAFERLPRCVLLFDDEAYQVVDVDWDHLPAAAGRLSEDDYATVRLLVPIGQ